MDLLAFGQFLREAREQRELSLDDAVKTLKIQRRILEAFEEGDFSQGGSPVQVRGMLRNYARFLRLEEIVVLQHYETALIPVPANRWRKKATEDTQSANPPTQPRRETLTAIPLSGGGRRSGLRFAWVGSLLTTLFGLGLIGVIVVLVGQILEYTPLPDTGQPTLAAQLGTLDPNLATATYTATWTPMAFVPTPTRLFLTGADGLAIEMNFVQRSWVRVMSDGTEQFAGIARPGDIQSYNAQEGFEVTLANAAAVELTVNGQSQAPFGARGSQVLILVNSTGIQVINPGATPTIDSSRVISPEVLTITETPDPALAIPATLAVEATPTIFEPTPIGAESIPTQTSAATDTAIVEIVPTLTPFDVAVNSSPSQDSATLVPTLTPFLPNSAASVESTANPETTPIPTLTPFSFAPTSAAVQSLPTEQPPVPTLTPFNAVSQITSAAQTTPGTAMQANTTQAQTNAVASATVRPSATATATATSTASPTATGTPDVRPTAIVPLRITQSGLPTRKAP